MKPRTGTGRRRKELTILALVLVGIAGIALLSTGLAEARHEASGRETIQVVSLGTAGVASAQAQEDGPSHPDTDLACRLCHGETDREIVFDSGETLPVQVDLDGLAASAHGSGVDTPLTCTECHQAADYQFPHEPVEAAHLREYQLARSANCERCHAQPHLTSHPGPESDSPVVCTDCHGSHDVRTVEQWQSGEGTETCVDCHLAMDVERSDPVQLTQIVREGMFAQRVDAEYCLACHSQPGLTLTFENGDVLSLTIDADALHESVHGADNPWQALDCTDCHDRYTYPHDRPLVTSEREYNLQRYTFCIKCHESHYDRTVDSVHGAAIEEGNLDAAVCTDCHGAHDTPPPNEPRERISHTCQQCHSTIFGDYSESIHGAALLEDSNPDVPTCINCHGVHDIHDPTTNLARLRSPELCGGCHADEALMAKYDISTDVFDTYVADFHGTTVTLFEHLDPEVETNKAVCYDCHGVHNIHAPGDPRAGIKANLLETCRQCHPDATENFSDAWTSHYRPSLENNTLVFLVDTFYAVFIPVVLGFFGFLVVIDIYGRIRRR